MGPKNARMPSPPTLSERGLRLPMRATESGHARQWAQLLVDRFVGSTVAPDKWVEAIPTLRQEFEAVIARHTTDTPQPWYVEERERQGEFATFLGFWVESVSADHWNWHALAVGDSCLFHTRGDNLEQSFPVKAAAGFHNSPWLIGSRTEPRRPKFS